MLRTALISLDHFAAQGSLLDCLPDLREKGIARVSPTHVVKLGYGQVASYVRTCRKTGCGIVRCRGASSAPMSASSTPRTCRFQSAVMRAS